MSAIADPLNDIVLLRIVGNHFTDLVKSLFFLGFSQIMVMTHSTKLGVLSWVYTILGDVVI